MHDVLIIGGGVMGLATAWELAKRGTSVCVLDRSRTGGEASWAGAGILPPGHRGPVDDPLAPLLRRASELWPAVSEELKAATGIDNGFRRCGEVQIVENPDAFEADVAGWERNGVRVERVTRDQLHEIEPAINPELKTAYLLPEACQVRNPWHVRALDKACRDLGVTILEDTEVLGINMGEGRAHSVHSSRGEIGADAIVVTCGAWTGRVLASLGIELAIDPVRGQIVLLKTDRPLVRRVLEIGARYLVPREDGHIIVGSTEEWVGFEKKNTAEGVAGLIAFARKLVPELASTEVERCWSGLRPHTKSGQPCIGAAPGYQNLYVAAGHFRGGLHLSTVTGRLMAQLIRGESPELSLAAFR
jgi:glycine oxidase